MLKVERALQRYVTSITGLPGDWAGDQGTARTLAICVNTEKGKHFSGAGYLGDPSNLLGRGRFLYKSKESLLLSQGGTLLSSAGPQQAAPHGTDMCFLPQFPHLFQKDRNTCPSVDAPSAGAISFSQNYAEFSGCQDYYHLFNPHNSSVMSTLQLDPPYRQGS